jgi:hypothetical protein
MYLILMQDLTVQKSGKQPIGNRLAACAHPWLLFAWQQE